MEHALERETMKIAWGILDIARKHRVSQHVVHESFLLKLLVSKENFGEMQEKLKIQAGCAMWNTG